MRIANGLTVAVAAMGIVAFTVGTANAAAIYSDNFDGPNSSILGLAPDVRPGSEVWVGYGTALLADGTFGGNSSAYLPFTPVAGNVYELSADVTGTAGNWSYFGFISADPTGGGAGYTLGSYGSYLYYKTTANPHNVRCDAGVGQTDTAFYSVPSSGVQNLKVVLDATDTNSANWTVEWIVDGIQARAPKKVLTGNLANIRYVGVNNLGGGLTGTIDNFLLKYPDSAGTVLTLW